ncbi:hypothetical protein [Kumtagia ephedrae]|jgi:hypothetical protein|uniref:Uncharacterized protein n=1 Tax=Kumtagia ephedrae TaxID=2116701 RepID=A0A2P7SRG9_9HYPH|nr:hypothetical protein [Mesorhizobium ephedrae]PSJ64925.1 hypothetical protein C7I84_04705 [Mesorhizobium ephedrae]
MSKILPGLHLGHAPIALHHAFHETMEALETWAPGEPEPPVFVDGRRFAATAVLAGMIDCTDLVPLRTRDVLQVLARSMPSGPTVESGDTYGRWAALLLSDCARRKTAEPCLPSAAADACASGAL